MIDPDLQAKFFSDPDWSKVEDLILNYIEPLVDMNTIDTTQPAEHVKAELIGRTLAYNKLVDFLNDSKLINRKLDKVKNPFR
jgi:hypothetical protein